MNSPIAHVVGATVEIMGIPGRHKIIEVAHASEICPHRFFRVSLSPGTTYGRRRAGDTISVEDWRCHLVSPVSAPE